MGDPIRCVIVDDEPPARRLLKRLLEQRDDVVVVAEAENGRDAVDTIRLASPDVVFLDVAMPELNGFEVLASLSVQETPLIVFVTAYDEYAVRAFEVNAVDYLLKPFDDSRVHSAVDRVIGEIDRENDTATDRSLNTFSAMTAGKEKAYLRRLGVPNGERSVVIRVDSIDRIEAEGKYVRIWSDERSHLLRRPISLMEKVLDPAVFVRVSRSAIVNLDRITQIIQPTPRECYVALGDSVRIKVTRGYERVINRLMFDVE